MYQQALWLDVKTAAKEELEANKIAIGNGLLRWVYNNDSTLSYAGNPEVKANDGAVPVDSAVGAAIINDAYLRNMGATDHEEFYGAPRKDGTLKNESAGIAAASTTLGILDLTAKTCACPKVTIERPLATESFPATPGTKVPLEVKLEWPGVDKPWPLIVKAEAWSTKRRARRRRCSP